MYDPFECHDADAGPERLKLLRAAFFLPLNDAKLELRPMGASFKKPSVHHLRRQFCLHFSRTLDR